MNDLHEIANIPRRRREGARRSNHAPTRLDIVCEALLVVAGMALAWTIVLLWGAGGTL